MKRAASPLLNVHSSTSSTVLQKGFQLIQGMFTLTCLIVLSPWFFIFSLLGVNISTMTIQRSARIGAPLCSEFYRCVPLNIYYSTVIFHGLRQNLGTLPSQRSLQPSRAVSECIDETSFRGFAPGLPPVCSNHS